MSGVNKECLQCGSWFKAKLQEIKRGGGKYCSANCYHKSTRGKRSPNWKGGRKINPQGYAEVYKPGHGNADKNGYVKEHRYVMAVFLGRKLSKKEFVHHIDGDRLNNKLENLEITSLAAHISLHRKGVSFTKEHCRKISEAKKQIAPFIKRNNLGQFIGGVNYVR